MSFAYHLPRRRSRASAIACSARSKPDNIFNGPVRSQGADLDVGRSQLSLQPRDISKLRRIVGRSARRRMLLLYGIPVRNRDSCRHRGSQQCVIRTAFFLRRRANFSFRVSSSVLSPPSLPIGRNTRNTSLFGGGTANGRRFEGFEYGVKSMLKKQAFSDVEFAIFDAPKPKKTSYAPCQPIRRADGYGSHCASRWLQVLPHSVGSGPGFHPGSGASAAGNAAHSGA